MIPGEDKVSKIDIAVAWYKQGRCPCCGLGEPRGWSTGRGQDLVMGARNVVDLAALRDDLSLLEPIHADIPSSRVPDLPLSPGPSGLRLFGLRRRVACFSDCCEVMPLHISMNASIEMTPVMAAEDLEKALSGVGAIIEKYG